MKDADYTIDLTQVDLAVERSGKEAEALIPILQDLQTAYGFLPVAALKRVAQLTRIRPADITGVASFYSQFRHEPTGKNVMRVCHGTACHVRGANRIQDELKRILKLPENHHTTHDGLFTVEHVQCLGCCTLAPVLESGKTIYGQLKATQLEALVEHIQTAQEKVPLVPGQRSSREDNKEVIQGEIRLCTDSCCVARGCGQVKESILNSIRESGFPVRIRRVGCVVECEQTPMIEVVRFGTETSQTYRRVQPGDVPTLLAKHFQPPNWKKRFQLQAQKWINQVVNDPEDWMAQPTGYRDPFVERFTQNQRHIATEHFGKMDPCSLDDYLVHDGFKGIQRCVDEYSSEEVISKVLDSGLRGRGGAGFPSGKKWEMVRKAQGERKFIVGNGDEGDPGAFMDRMLMESFPFRVIEGMLIAAYAVGAREGFIYVRAEYPFAVEQLQNAIEQCYDRGFLGIDIFKGALSFDLKIKQGAGAFVCGEETALIASIEGKRGMPKLRPPFPAQCGLWDCPTLVNNVETLSLLPWILRHEPADFNRLGTEKSKGTKVFALAGKIKQGGLIEVPMGMTIREIVEDIGGGILDNKKFKAVLVGGPSGGCVPASMADTPIDYEALQKAGAIMGSGGLVVLDEDDCMVDIARYFLKFTQIESCGKCTFCRVGTRKMLDIFDRLCKGKGRKGDVDELEYLAGMVVKGSICGLGRTAPNPTLSTLRFFRDEYEAHLKGICPSGKCRDLIRYEVSQNCTGCTLCSQHCPADAIPMTPYRRHVIDNRTCTCCDTCKQLCPEQAIEIKSGSV